MSRLSIPDFALANPLYRNASLSFYTVVSGAKTATLATLYSGQSGVSTLANPQKLDSKGKFKQPVYVAVDVIGTVNGISIPSHDTGIIKGTQTRFRINTTTGFLEFSNDAGVSWTSTGNPGGQFLPVADLASTADLTKGDALVGVMRNAVGAIARTQHDVNEDTWTIKSIGSVAGDDATDDTAGLAATIAAAPAGCVIDGLGLTCLATQVTINKALTIKNLTIHMKNPAGATAVQRCFNVTADNVKLIDCGTTIVPAEIPSVTDASGAYATGVSGFEVIRGTYDGSKNPTYAATAYHSPIYALNCTAPRVSHATVLNSDKEGVYFEGCTRPYAFYNKTSDTAGSGVATDGGTAAQVAFNYVTASGTSGLAINSPDSRVVFNHVKDPDTYGIAVGEGTAIGTEVIGNLVEGAGQASAADYASILVQQSDRIKVNYNVIKAPKNNTGAGFYTAGIQFSNGPLTLEAIGNDINSTYGIGIYVFDQNDDCTANIEGNTIKSPWIDGIYVDGFKRASVRGNNITEANSGAFVDGLLISGIKLGANSTTPHAQQEYLEVTDNKIIDGVPNQGEAVRLETNFAATTSIRIRGNTARGWVTRPYTSGRTGNYDVSGNDWDDTAKSGLVTLTNGGTTTTVTTDQSVADTYPALSIGNAACATLNPVMRVSALSHGSFEITHTAGTAAAEQVRWRIP